MVWKGIDQTILNVRAKFLWYCVPDTIERKTFENGRLRNGIKWFVEIKSWTDNEKERNESFASY